MNSGPKKFNKVSRKKIDVRKYNKDYQIMLKNNSKHKEYSRVSKISKEINTVSKSEINNDGQKPQQIIIINEKSDLVKPNLNPLFQYFSIEKFLSEMKNMIELIQQEEEIL